MVLLEFSNAEEIYREIPLLNRAECTIVYKAECHCGEIENLINAKAKELNLICVKLLGEERYVTFKLKEKLSIVI